MSVRLGRHLCSFMHQCLFKLHPKLPKVVQELLFQIGVALQSWRRTDLCSAIAIKAHLWEKEKSSLAVGAVHTLQGLNSRFKFRGIRREASLAQSSPPPAAGTLLYSPVLWRWTVPQVKWRAISSALDLMTTSEDLEGEEAAGTGLKALREPVGMEAKTSIPAFCGPLDLKTLTLPVQGAAPLQRSIFLS